MGLRKLKTARAKLDPDMQKEFSRDYSRRKKSLLVAYIAWLLLVRLISTSARSVFNSPSGSASVVSSSGRSSI